MSFYHLCCFLMSILYRRLGLLMMATGALHTLLGFLVFTGPARAIWQAGVWNSIARDYSRATILWFTCSGVLLLLMGYLMHWILRQQPLPRALGVGLAVLGLAGGVIMPASGFWLVLVLAILVLNPPRAETTRSNWPART